ncbi:hypothetical protein GB931_19490 [Modestobacter sp. I12A-02628]|uniref:Uncharacterized protein n=1 Tax=Goekera deserti TaxID=2497753 RepID=A0A7K3WFJ3_9ACTN|nr:hypothetical protein [Goekera deserti]MPR00063.1 hypothetical protein [Goekera deserti]NDI49842.1 hypothetical protein [Goekera deserti]NEL55204.1 hypothetical protein [Goekera deserti]
MPDHPAGTAWPDPAAGPPFGAPDGAPQRGQDPPTAVQPAVGPWQQPTDVVPPSPPGWGAPGREHVRSTGPVDQVPVPPALRPGRVSGPADAGEGSPRARDRAALTGLALAALALVVLQVGLSLRFDDGPRLWEVLPTWSAFATVAVLLLAVPVAARSGRAGGVGAGTAWQVAAGGVACLAAFWVLVVLPFVASDRGFTLTAALALAAGALWLSPGRTR